MSLLDLFIAALLAAGLVRGAATGALRQVAGVASFVVGFLVAVRLMHPAGALVAASLDLSPRLAPLVGFGLVFGVVQLVAFALVRLSEGLLSAVRLTAVNRAVGGMLGAFKAALLLSVLFLLLGVLDVPGASSRSASLLYRPVASVLPAAWNYVAARAPDADPLGRRFRAVGEAPR